MEHNVLCSYQGLSCLMQLAIPGADFIVDTLALHDHMHMLRPAFTNPRILKVTNYRLLAACGSAER
jgi:ribonuclease D